MAAKFKFKKSKNNHNPFPHNTLYERYLKERELNPRTNYVVEKCEGNYFTFTDIKTNKDND